MNDMLAISIGRDALYLTLTIAGPMLIGGLVVGLAVGIFQAVTQIHEMTLTFIPKIFIIAVSLVLFLPWMINKFVDFTTNLLETIPILIR